MTDKPSTETLPFEVAGVEEGEDILELTYRNEIGNSVTRRTYRRAGDSVHETDEEWMFNYRTGEWERVHQFTREYELDDDGDTLVGDGSGWDGAGRSWRDWFKARHFKRLEIRYQHDTIPDAETAQTTRSTAVA
jgi:hypothetical protein